MDPIMYLVRGVDELLFPRCQVREEEHIPGAQFKRKNVWFEFWLEKPLEFRLEISYTKKLSKDQ